MMMPLFNLMVLFSKPNRYLDGDTDSEPETAVHYKSYLRVLLLDHFCCSHTYTGKDIGHRSSSPAVSSLSPHRYEILTPNAIPKGFMDGKQACERMVQKPA